MASRQDQLHSYQFMVQRVIAALVMRETDPAQSPFRRVAGAVLVGVLLAALSLGGAAAYGLIVPGGSSRWKTQDAVIVEKGSGALFVYRDGKLNPVLNYTSALLLVGAPSPRTVSVTRASLEGVPRGSTYGILGAPDLLPARHRLSAGTWTVCTSRSGVQQRPTSTLFVTGAPDEGGRDLAGGESPEAILVATPDGARYAIIGNRRHLVRDPEIILPGLVWTAEPIPVDPAFISALPAGADLVRFALRIVGFGTPAARPAGGKIGQVYLVKRVGGGQDYFVALADGLAALTPLQAQILLADPMTSARIGVSGATGLNLGIFAAMGAEVSQFAPSEGEGALPLTPPPLVATAFGALCATLGGVDGSARVRRGVLLKAPSEAVSAGSVATGAAVLADRVVVGPGEGALVAASPSAGATSATVSLVTDTGMRFAISDEEVLGMLGYGGRSPVRLPSELVSLVPAGPALDREAARAPVG
ncbi:MAG: type VII secretion protein EccB [Micromonosporaceae bacterium]|nr:type VII secretion protein EccB [Micromonosporaceae bacterium]